MIKERFYLFVLRINSISKYINKLKFDFAPQLGVKNVHIFWLYELYVHPEGLTASELASRAMISRSLISREIENLLENGYIQMQKNSKGKRMNYNAHITLTEKGVNLAQNISKKGMEVQARVNQGISEEDLIIFYSTLEKLQNNLRSISEEWEKNGISVEEDIIVPISATIPADL
ncbi:MAG: winged helix-turn-helix transcriptional regulator [Clostridia bacterium]|nr:winged helix-turn-helix transcriptional regulator [Clostridia bacterium]